MLTARGQLAALREYFARSERELLCVLLNSTSSAEANLALAALLETVPEKSLVHAANLREVIAALPASPFTMTVDEERLAAAAGLERGMALLSRVLPDGIELAVTTAGNLVLDVIVRGDSGKHYWNSVPVTEDYVQDAVLELLIESDYLLDAVLDLVKSMGLVFNPKFYLSIDDWRLDHAAEAMRGFGELF